MRSLSLILITTVLSSALVSAADPLPIDPLWKSESFRKSITASYGIDSRIEPRITEDEAFYLDESAKAMAANDRALAIKTLADSSLLPESPAMLFSLATLEFEEGMTESSLKHFEEAIGKFPNFRDAHRNFAVALVQTDDLKKAKIHLTRALELGAQDGLTAGLLAYCHAREGHHQAALDAYRLALITQPEETQWKLGAAQALIALDHPREAASILQSLIDAAPEETSLWLTQADAWINLDDERRAASNLELVHRAGGLDPNTTLFLGHLYLQNRLPELALERYRSAVTAAEPATPSRALEALEMLVQSADWERAKDLAALLDQSALYHAAFDPATADKDLLSRLTRSRALIELETGDHATGAKRVEEWLRVEPMDGNALLLLARFREEAGERAEAEMLIEQATRIPESAAAAYLAHGRLLVAIGDYGKAIGHLEKAQELDPNENLAHYITAIRELIGR